MVLLHYGGFATAASQNGCLNILVNYVVSRLLMIKDESDKKSNVCFVIV
jgi:hypothetical protein